MKLYLLTPCLMALMLLSLIPAGTHAQDLDYIGQLSPALLRWLLATRAIPITSLDPPYLLRLTNYLSRAWYDAYAPYHPTAFGTIYGGQLRRPAAEATLENIETALSYASFKVLLSLYPNFEEVWEDTLTGLGYELDPGNDPNDLSNPVTIGILVGNALADYAEHDGMNQLGDTPLSRELSRSFQNPTLRYADYTDYEPVNTAYHIFDRWQPLLEKSPLDVWFVQTHVTPQARYTKPYGFCSPKQFVDATPGPISYQADPEAFEEQMWEMVRLSSELTDERKVTAEHFDGKIGSLAAPVSYIARVQQWSLERYIVVDYALNAALYDAYIAAWDQKLRFDTVRPVSAINNLWGDKELLGYAGPKRGIDVIKGREWRSYLQTMPHGDFPSGSTCFCAAFASYLRKELGTDSLFGFTATFTAGSSVREPGITPKENITLSWDTLTEYVQECAFSRIFGGVHFRKATLGIIPICTKVGELAWEKRNLLFNGQTAPLNPFERDVYPQEMGHDDGKYSCTGEVYDVNSYDGEDVHY
ncbi:Vanadium-dependent haloperoxidase [Balamuthia mandrillaris]